MKTEQWMIEGRVTNNRVTRARVRVLAQLLKSTVKSQGGVNLRPLPTPAGVSDHSKYLTVPDRAKIRSISQYVVHDGEVGDYTIVRCDCLADHAS